MLKVIADSTLNQSFSAGSQLRSWVAQKTYNLEYGAQDLLALIHRARARRRFHSAALVGPGGDHSDRIHLVVAGLPQRLVRVSPHWENISRPRKKRTSSAQLFGRKSWP